MNDLVDVAIVGAGPYGLSLAAHLREHDLRVRQFGTTMEGWAAAMPRGMFLKSEGFASSLSDPDRSHTLEAYCRTAGEPYKDTCLPVSLDRFVSYGRWFQQHLVPEVEDTDVTGVTREGDGYLLTTAAAERVRARNVVIATGLRHFAHVPGALAGLPAELCSHVSAHSDLAAFRGRDVVVIGAGQSALESATLLHESDAGVHLVARRPALVWNTTPQERPSLADRARRPKAGLGNGWPTWFYSTKPAVFRRLPPERRLRLARTALGPAGSWWLRPRMDGHFPVTLGHRVTGAEPVSGGVRLRLRAHDGTERDLLTQHVIAATGYRPTVARIPLLDDRLRAGLRLIGGTPSVGPDFQSNVPGLFFAGAIVAPSFGPVMRFVYGADFAARTLARRLGRQCVRNAPVGIRAASYESRSEAAH